MIGDDEEADVLECPLQFAAECSDSPIERRCQSSEKGRYGASSPIFSSPSRV